MTIANSGFQSLVGICDCANWERLRHFSKIQDQFSRNQDSRIVRDLSLPTALVQIDRRNRTQLADVVCLASLRHRQFDHTEPPTSLVSLLANAGVDNLIPDPYGAGELLRFVIDGQPVIPWIESGRAFK